MRSPWKVGQVIGGLKPMGARSAQANHEMIKLIDYLHEHRHRTTYERLRRGGYPLGSGGIESANKFICHTRLKRSGAWWYEREHSVILTPHRDPLYNTQNRHPNE